MGLRLVICHAAIWHSYCTSLVWVYQDSSVQKQSVQDMRDHVRSSMSIKAGLVLQIKVLQGLEHLCLERKLCLKTSEMHDS